jgi:predicted nuclease of restriction endonuclease-like (RecB) superfamily
MKPARSPVVLAKASALPVSPRALLSDVRRLIVQSRTGISRAVNAALVALYWEVGRRIRRDILREKRAEYGERILQALSAKLTVEFGRGYSARNLASMVRFAGTFPHANILQALTAKLGWTHFQRLIYIDDQLKREFYAEMCRVESWSTRTLNRKIDGLLFERTALSRKPAILARRELATLRTEDRLSPDLVFRDPYILDFLGLKDSYAEHDVETAILREMEAFILELGEGFSFIARQKRMTVGGVDHHLDLLFYHRKLKRLVAIDLKLGDFTPADKGQMELYLAWLREHETLDGEGLPLGLILCAGKNDETVRLLGLDRGEIRVAAYLARTLPQVELERKLHEATRLARRRRSATRGR